RIAHDRLNRVTGISSHFIDTIERLQVFERRDRTAKGASEVRKTKGVSRGGLANGGNPMLRRLASVLAISFPLALSACVGGRSSAEAATTPVPTPTPTPTPPPAPDPLQADLVRLSGQANAGLLPAAPPQNPDLVSLGQALFFDRVLSGNRNISCYTC